MGLYRSLAGQLTVRLTSADPTAALAAVMEAGIVIHNTVMDGELTVCFTMERRDYRRLRSVAGRRGDLLQIAERKGRYWDLKRLTRRPVFLLGIVLYFILALYVPSRVYLIEVEGNTSIPANRILEAASKCGISFGASRRTVRSEQVKNALLEAMPELGWAGVNTYGCRAVISVRQRQPEPDQTPQPPVTSIVAARDGHILSCNVTSGNGLCVPGQVVKAGEVLISGYTDCGICITAGRAEGEVMAATTRHLTAVTPLETLVKTGEKKENVNFSLIIGNNRINFDKNSGISDASCGRMVTEYHLTLPGGYRLPMTLVKETVTHAELTCAETKAEELLRDFAAYYLGTQMIAGTITGSTEAVSEGDGLWILTGDYACTEMIGSVRVEQNGELHETD